MACEKWGLLAVPNTATCTADASRYSVDYLESGMQSLVSPLRCDMSYTGCPRRNVPDFGRVFLMLNVYRYNPKHLCPKLKGYGDNDQRSLKL